MPHWQSVQRSFQARISICFSKVLFGLSMIMVTKSEE